jgi:hypothetical protein
MKKNLFTLLSALLLLNASSQTTFFSKTISFSTVKPAGSKLIACWNALGVDSTNHVYVVFGTGNSWENCNMFRYNATTNTPEYLGNFIDVLKANDNYEAGENVPKGHSELPFYGGKVYFGTQPFHDLNQYNWNDPDEGWQNHRGSHLLAYDTTSHVVSDLSKKYTDGVIQKWQGIMGLQVLPDSNYLVGMSIPESDLIVYDPATNNVKRIIEGPSDVQELQVGRFIVTYKSKVFYQKDWMDYELYRYDFTSGELTKTSLNMKGGFWNGKAQSKINKNIFYLSTVMGNIYKFDAESETMEFLTNPYVGNSEFVGEGVPYSLYCMALTQDEKHLLVIPSKDGSVNPSGFSKGSCYALNTQTLLFEKIGNIGAIDDYFTGNNIKDKQGRIYFAKFKNNGGSVDGTLVQIDPSKMTFTPTDVNTIYQLPFHISNNTPNPFSESTTFNIALSQKAKVTATLFDASGRVIATFLNSLFLAGNHQIVLGANDLNSNTVPGVYHCLFTVTYSDRYYVVTKKIVYVL